MATQAQIDANRANAQKSTGPRTAEGRAAVGRNAIKHGLTSMSPVAPGEDPAEFLQFLDRWTQAYLPIGPAEEEVLRTAVVASWRLRRIPAIEAGYYEMERGEIEPNSVQDQSPGASLAFAHYACAKQLEALSCQEARLQRTFDKSLRELERLQSLPSRGLKNGLENQTQFSPPPDETASSNPASEPLPEKQTQFDVQSEENKMDAAVSTPCCAGPSAAASEELPLENQTQIPDWPASDAIPQHEAPAPEGRTSENQTQFQAEPENTETGSAAAPQPAHPPQTARIPITRRPPRTAGEIEREFAAKIVARMFAGLPKTA